MPSREDRSKYCIRKSNVNNNYNNKESYFISKLQNMLKRTNAQDIYKNCNLVVAMAFSVQLNFSFNAVSNLFTPQHQYTYSPYCSLYISHGADEENLFNHQFTYSPYCSPYISHDADKENSSNDQELLQLVIILFILMTLMFDSGVIL